MMNKKSIMAMTISALTGAMLGYHGVLLYGDNISQDRENEENAVKKWRENDARNASVTSNNSDRKKLSLQDILKENNHYRKNCNLNTYYASIKSEQREAELQKILALHGEQRNQVLVAFFKSWAKQEPRRALATAAKLSDSCGRGMDPYYVFNAWAEKNPEEAATYFLENKDQWGTDGEIRTGIGIVEHLAKISPGKALEWIAHFEDKEAQDVLKTNLINLLAKKDPFALLKNSTQLFPGEENKTYAAIAGQWAKQNPVAAQQWVETLPEEEKKKSYQSVVLALSENNPEEAMALARKNLDLKTLSSIDNSNLIFALHGNAPSQAREWIKSFPDSSEKSSIMQNYASWWPDRNYTAQAEFIFTIPDKEIRANAMSYAIITWLHDDDVAAKKWLDKADLNKEEKAYIYTLQEMY